MNGAAPEQLQALFEFFTYVYHPIFICQRFKRNLRALKVMNKDINDIRKSAESSYFGRLFSVGDIRRKIKLLKIKLSQSQSKFMVVSIVLCWFDF